jgi:hypothetical protein
MKRTKLMVLTAGLMAVAIAFAIPKLTVRAQDDPQDNSPDPGRFGVEGTWEFLGGPVDCTTGDPLGPPGGKPPSLASYNRGGTFILESPGVPSSRRYPALGVWQHVRARTYELVFKVYQYNADGTSNGKQIANIEAEHNLDDTITHSAVVRTYNAAGDLTNTRCMKSTGTRFTGEN